jgi:hypothetical protein
MSRNALHCRSGSGESRSLMNEPTTLSHSSAPSCHAPAGKQFQKTQKHREAGVTPAAVLHERVREHTERAHTRLKVTALEHVG